VRIDGGHTSYGGESRHSPPFQEAVVLAGGCWPTVTESYESGEDDELGEIHVGSVM
jgi:hypothetical protein